MRIILFNAPPKSGKDEAVNFLASVYHDVVPFSFKSKLKEITLTIYGIKPSVWDGWYTTEGKEIPRPELNGISCRQALIHVSENCIKKAFGNSYFGQVEAKHLKTVPDDFIACSSDSGFPEEVYPLVEAFGRYNVHIVKIYRDGCSFNGDSRNWIHIPEVIPENYHTIENNSTLEDFYKKVSHVYNLVKNQ